MVGYFLKISLTVQMYSNHVLTIFGEESLRTSKLHMHTHTHTHTHKLSQDKLKLKLFMFFEKMLNFSGNKHF